MRELEARRRLEEQEAEKVSVDGVAALWLSTLRRHRRTRVLPRACLRGRFRMTDHYPRAAAASGREEA